MKANDKQRPAYNYYYSPKMRPAKPAAPPPQKRRRRKFTLFVVVIVVVLAGIAAHEAISSKAKTDVKQTINNVTHAKTPPAPRSDLIPAAKLSSMGSDINAVISQNPAIDISVNLIDLNTGQSEHYGTNEAFTAASTTKVITAADFLSEIEAGRQSLGETINGNTAEYELQQMIVISDDNAWAALNDALGYSQLQTYAHNLGLSSFQSEPNTVTSADMALILQKLWDGQLLDKSDTQLLLSWLKEANYRQYIVPAVPAGDTIYHKIGLYEDNVHDEAIITSGSKAFVIVIFTNGNGTYNWPARATLMQQITKAALATYF